MNRLDTVLEEMKKKKRIGLMTHVVIGFPTLGDTIKLIKVMSENGADIIELQIPFSDPLADGPTIMRACEKSLANGTKVKDAFIVAEKLTQQISTPLLFMAYYNTVFRYGVEKFCADAVKVGIVGFIVPDMPLEEESDEHFFAMCKKYNLHAIHVVSPVSTGKRLRKNAAAATGFVYATARQGITGVRRHLEQNVEEYLEKVHNAFSIPIAVGFGISKKEHLEALKNKANIVVVGSAIIDIVNSSTNMEKDVKDFLIGINMVR